MSTWVGMAPVIGTSSLDGFAIGALMSGACALAITAPRRAQARRAQAPTARGGSARAAERSGWLCEHVLAAEAVWPVVAAEAFEAGMAARADGAVVAARADGAVVAAEAGETEGAGAAGAERLARPDELGALGPGRSAVVREGRSGGYRSRHRIGDPLPGSAPWDDVPPDSGSRGGTFPGDAFPRGAFAGAGSWRDAHPELTFPDEEFSDYAFGSAKRPSVRRLPRHAAPSAGFGRRITSFGGRMSSLVATRALASGARG
jgi:hypothetical protein